MPHAGRGAAAERARQALYEARLRAGRTQEDASAKRSTSTISRWESGIQEPSWDALDAYAMELGQPIVLGFGPPPDTGPPAWADELRQEIVSDLRAVIDFDRLADELEARLRRLLSPAGER